MVSGAFTVGDLFQSAVKAGASPKEALELVEQAFEMEGHEEQGDVVVDKDEDQGAIDGWWLYTQRMCVCVCLVMDA